MSRHSSHERIVTVAGSAEVLECIKEVQPSPISSSIIKDSSIPKTEELEDDVKEKVICPCKAVIDAEIELKHSEEIERLLKEKEIEMEEKFKNRMEHEMEYLKDRFELILHNEQVRASYMLREAHRERQEKISALQNQLECKNLAGLMYVMCSERRKNKMEMMKICEEYTSYIESLQKLLTESQALILHLSRGYKTAARVDNEWREKMKKILKHYQNFVNNFIGGTPETNQYLFDITNLLKTEAPVKDNPVEDPCDNENELPTKEEPETEKPWCKRLEGDHPFIMFGDMSDFKPPQRREIIKAVKAAKTAPKKWKEYAFNNMWLKSTCPNADTMKREYFKIKPDPDKWECTIQTDRQAFSRGSDTSRRVTTASVDIRGNMGSLLKMITSSAYRPAPTPTLLGARDSMEIASTTKLDSLFQEMRADMEEEVEETEEPEVECRETKSKLDDEEVGNDLMSALGSIHNDSLQVIPSHVPDHDHNINNEKICPMEKCQKLQVDSFMRSLPAYMRESPFAHFELGYDEYKACSPEQLEILKKRIEEKKKRERDMDVKEQNPLLSWTPSLEGVGIQTSDMSVSLPPCTCQAPCPSPVSSIQKVYTVADLIPVKQKVDEIKAKCFFDDSIEFNRFKVIGQDESVINLLVILLLLSIFFNVQACLRALLLLMSLKVIPME
ncbi:unnamed protein product, partial [Brenthis ino]